MWLEKLYRESLWMFYCNLYYIVTGSVTVLCQILYCLKNKASGDPAVHSGLRIWLPAAQVAMEPWVRSLAQQSELRICCCHAYGIDHSFGSYSVPGQGMSMCCRCSHKIKKKIFFFSLSVVFVKVFVVYHESQCFLGSGYPGLVFVVLIVLILIHLFGSFAVYFL